MKVRIIAILCALIVSVALVFAKKSPLSISPDKETRMPQIAKGTFEVKVTPASDEKGDPNLGRFTMDKEYRGDLEGIGKGQMLTAGTAVKGSGAYVAIEKVTGSLRGRTGSFVLQHMGTMTQGLPQMSVAIVPDSGMEELAGIIGKMNIIIADGKHSYELTYALP
jgi:hypothetical protein